MPGRLIVFEGTDGSGKSTQFARLCARLDDMGRSYQKLVFPQYDQPSSALIRMYLGGQFGTHPADVNPYAASAFYAVDRYASLKKVWGDYYEKGGLVLTDRYTTSNAVHQAVKCAPEDRGDFLRWLDDFEHNKMGLPGGQYPHQRRHPRAGHGLSGRLPGLRAAGRPAAELEGGPLCGQPGQSALH